MHLAYTPEQQELRTELRAYFTELVPENVHARYADPAAQKRFSRETIRRLGSDGWPPTPRLEAAGNGFSIIDLYPR